MLEPGISSYTYTWAIGVPSSGPEHPMGAYGLIDKAVELGVKVVQIADNLPLENLQQKELIDLKIYAQDRQVKIEVGARKLTKERLEQHIAIANTLDSDLLRFVIDGPGYEPTLDKAVEIIKSSLSMLKNNNVRLAIENHDRLLATEFVEIIQQVGDPSVGICLDTVNSMGAAEGLETVIERLGPLCINLHVKEFTVKRISHLMGFAIEGLPLGTGMLPVGTILQRLGSGCRTAILEQWPPPVEGDLEATIKRENEWAVQSMAYLKNVLAEAKY